MSSNRIFLPGSLTQEQIVQILLSISREEKDHPEIREDFVVVDVVNGQVNIRHFQRSEILQECETSGLTPLQCCRKYIDREKSGMES